RLRACHTEHQANGVVIARSPNIRIIIELFDHMVERTLGARRFAEYIDDLGFTMLRIGENGSLQPFEKGITPSGENYFLLTRSARIRYRSHAYHNPRRLPELSRHV